MSEYKPKTYFRSIFRFIEDNKDKIEEHDYRFSEKGMTLLALHLFDEIERRERFLSSRERTLERLKKLHAPDIIVENEERIISEGKSILKSFKAISDFAHYADMMDEQNLIEEGDPYRALEVLEDSMRVQTNKGCIHCANSYMKDGKWICGNDGHELKEQMIIGATGIDRFCFEDEPCERFWLDDNCEADYEDFLCSHPHWGDSVLEKNGADKDEDGEFYYADRMELAISNHHVVLQKHGVENLLKHIFPDKTPKDAAKWIIDGKKGN